jgi:hypothetical protein
MILTEAIIRLIGETDAGSAGTQPARDNRSSATNRMGGVMLPIWICSRAIPSTSNASKKSFDLRAANQIKKELALLLNFCNLG